MPTVKDASKPVQGEPVNVLDPIWQAKMLQSNKVAELVPVPFDGGWDWKGPKAGLLFLGYPFCRVWAQDLKDGDGKVVGQLPEGLIADIPFSLVRIGRADAKHCLIYVRADVYNLPETKVEEWSPPPDSTPKTPELLGSTPQEDESEEVSSTWMGATK